MNNLKEFEVKKTTEFTFNFFIDNLKKYYFIILLFMVIIDYILYYQLGFELSYFTYIIDISFDVDRIIWTLIFPLYLFLFFFIFAYLFYITNGKNYQKKQYKYLIKLSKVNKQMIIFLTIYTLIFFSPMISPKFEFKSLIEYLFQIIVLNRTLNDFSVLLFFIFLIPFCFIISYLIFIFILLKIQNKLNFFEILIIIFIVSLTISLLHSFVYFIVFNISTIQYFKIFTALTIPFFTFNFIFTFSIYNTYIDDIVYKYNFFNQLIIIISSITLFIFFFVIYFNNYNWHKLKNFTKNTPQIELKYKFSFNLFLNPFFFETNNYETLIELDKKGVLEKEFQKTKTKNFKDKNISYLIVDRNNTKYIRVPIDGEEANSTHFMTSKFLPLSKNNAIHFIINPTKCDYKNQTCDIVALMTSYHLVGNKEYYKLLTYSIIEGQIK